MTSAAIRVSADIEAVRLSRLAAAFSTSGGILDLIEAWEGAAVREKLPRLHVDPDGAPTEKPTPDGATRCSCGDVVLMAAEFVTCRCGRVHTSDAGKRDETADAALDTDAARAARKALTRHLRTIRTAIDAISATLQPFTRPTPTEIRELRKAADGEVDQARADHDQWCVICRRAGMGNEPRSTRPQYSKHGLCSPCGKLYALLLREKGIQDEHATAVLFRLVKDGHRNPTAAQVTEAAGVTADIVTATSARPGDTRKLPASVRRKGWHDTDDYLNTAGIMEAS